MLDAIMSPTWEFRYYSFNSRWFEGEMIASMRNGSGDHWFALLTAAGVALHGLAHEALNFRPDSPWPGIFEGLPQEFHANFLHEAAFDTANSTFCICRGVLRTEDRCRRCFVDLSARATHDGLRATPQPEGRNSFPRRRHRGDRLSGSGPIVLITHRCGIPGRSAGVRS
jgi:hypothetical protein